MQVAAGFALSARSSSCMMSMIKHDEHVHIDGAVRSMHMVSQPLGLVNWPQLAPYEHSKMNSAYAKYPWEDSAGAIGH